MTAVPNRKLTTAEYLALEEKAEYKSEFYQGEMFAMAGATIPHNRVKENLSIEIGYRLKGGDCETFSIEQRLLVDASGLYTYPDLMVVCGGARADARSPTTIVNPRVIFEVLSPGTELYDRGAKFRQYQRIPSLAEYVLVSQDEPLVERFVRQTDGNWLLSTFAGLESEFSLSSVGVRVPMVDVYRNVEFPAAGGTQ